MFAWFILPATLIAVGFVLDAVGMHGAATAIVSVAIIELVTVFIISIKRTWVAAGRDDMAVQNWTPATLTPEGWQALRVLLSPDDVEVIHHEGLPVVRPSWLATGPLAGAVKDSMAVLSDLSRLGVEVSSGSKLGRGAFGAYCVFWTAPRGSFKTQAGRREHVISNLRRDLACVAAALAHGIAREGDILARLDTLAREAEVIEGHMQRMEAATYDLIRHGRPESDHQATLRLGGILSDVVLERMDVVAAVYLAKVALASGNAYRDLWNLRECGFVVEDELAPAEFFR